MCHPLLVGYLYFCVIWTKIGDFAPTHVHKRWEQGIKVLQNGTCVFFTDVLESNISHLQSGTKHKQCFVPDFVPVVKSPCCQSAHVLHPEISRVVSFAIRIQDTAKRFSEGNFPPRTCSQCCRRFVSLCR